jgi:uncharacterized membrane protein YkgB
MKTLIQVIADNQRYFINFLKISIFVVMAWIGGLKAYPYEAEGIVLFIANSGFVRFLK